MTAYQQQPCITLSVEEHFEELLTTMHWCSFHGNAENKTNRKETIASGFKRIMIHCVCFTVDLFIPVLEAKND